MATERKWQIVWASWVAFFIVAETKAIKSDHPHAPMSHHMRKTLRIKETSLGHVVLWGAGGWLSWHLLREMAEEMNN